MSDDTKGKVVRVVYPVFPVVERTHQKVLEEGGLLNQGWLPRYSRIDTFYDDAGA